MHSFSAANGGSDGLDLAFLRGHAPEMVASAEARREAAAALEAPRAADRGGARDLERLLEQHQGNVSQVAQGLGKPRSHVYRALRALGLSPERYRPRKS